MKHAFMGYHPIVNFTYFTLVQVCAMFLRHPACLLISLLCSFFYSVKLNGTKALKFNLFFLVPTLLVSALMNPAFNHAHFPL